MKMINVLQHIDGERFKKALNTTPESPSLFSEFAAELNSREKIVQFLKDPINLYTAFVAAAVMTVTAYAALTYDLKELRQEPVITITGPR
jgi:hypothetical protein